MKYFIAFLLPVEAEQQARDIAQDARDTFHLKDAFKKSLPHITIKVPFTGSAYHDKAELHQFLEKFVRGRKPIPVTLKRFGHFNIGVIYWDVIQKDESLTLLQKELCDGLESLSWVTFDSIEPNGIPHVNLCSGDIRGRFESIYEHMYEKHSGETFAVLKELALFQKPLCTEQWEIAETYTLE